MIFNRRIKDVRVKAVICLVASLVAVSLLDYQSTLSNVFEQDDQGLRGRLSLSQTPFSDDGRRRMHIPASLDVETQRRLSLNLGGGACKWEPPLYDVPEDVTFYKTLIAGFPSCDKRMTFTQMEALTGWPARDEWDFVFGDPTNHPFIKSNYPHHEGYWSWGTRADQVVMVVRNMRRTMVEYFDITWDISSAKISELDINDVLYKYRPPMDKFLTWRDLRVMDEISWYGWFIDYWMEGGLRRDWKSHRITTVADWPEFPPEATTPACASDKWHRHIDNPNTCSNNQEFIKPTPPPTKSPTFFPTNSPTTSPTHSPTTSPTITDNMIDDFIVTNATHPAFLLTTPPQGTTAAPPPPDQPHIPEQYLFNSADECCQASGYSPCYLVDVCPTPAPTPAIPMTYDEHCGIPGTGTGEVTTGCEPVAVISAEKLRDENDGPAETVAIANVLMNRPGISEFLIEGEAWNCIWEELIPNGRGNRMVNDRVAFGTETYTEEDYGFSPEMLEKMLNEYDRLILKYSALQWTSKSTAVRLVQLLMEHRNLVQIEYNDSSRRVLTDQAFLGPVERERRRILKAQAEGLSGEDTELSLEEKKKHYEYFMELEDRIKTQKRHDRARQREEERLAARKAAQTKRG